MRASALITAVGDTRVGALLEAGASSGCALSFGRDVITEVGRGGVPAPRTSLCIETILGGTGSFRRVT